MADWAGDIVERLDREQPWGLAGLLGLERHTDGEAFESRLGMFLAWERSLPTVAELSNLGEEDASGGRPKVFQAWLNRAKLNASTVNKVVFDSLFANFAQSRVAAHGAAQAYGTLLDLLRLPRRDIALTVATTNYDFAIEEAMSVLGMAPEWGEQAKTSFTGATPPVTIENLTQATELGRTPILHLHGRVGWYMKDDGQMVSVGADGVYNKDFGAPGLLLPEPQKRYDEYVPFRLMWDEFRKAIERASRILVLGHSLNDVGLRDALRPVAGSRLRVTICVAGGAGTGPYEQEKSRITGLLPDLPPGALIPLRFGPQLVADGNVNHAFESWPS